MNQFSLIQNKETIPLFENFRLKFHIQHKFKQYDAPLIRAIVPSNHSYCNHCGAPIIRNALKCTRKIQKSMFF